VIIVIKNYYFYIVNLLTRWPFQLEAPGDGDDATVVVDIKGEPSGVQEITEGHTQAESPQKDVEADANIEGTKVWGSEF
jgi:hypothetical protein